HLVELELTGFDLRKIENVVDDVYEMITTRPDRLDELLPPLVEARISKQRRHSDDGVHRCADLVAHVGEKFRLGLSRGLGSELGALEVGLRPLSLDELPDLNADGVERCEQALVRLPNFMAEKFHHSEEATR